MEENQKKARVERRVEAIMGFYVHFAAFAVTMIILLAVNILFSSVWWVQWPILGWGLGVLAHAVAVFWRTPGIVSEWRMKKIRELSEKP